MNDNLNKLEELNKTLMPPRELSGIFLPRGEKKQFDFMLIAEMPSMSVLKDLSDSGGNFNISAPDKFLQEIMIKYGIAGTYVTDIVKEGSAPGRPSKEEIRKWLPFLLKEIEILQPKYMIVLGKTNYENNFKKFVEPFISKSIKIDWVWHYSQQGRKTNAEVEQRFGEVVNKMRNN